MTVRYILVLSSLLFLQIVSAEVTELSNTEMTEAYIEDGAIVIKQRHAAPAPKPKQKIRLKVGPGEPAVSEVETVAEFEEGRDSQSSLIQQEYVNRNSSQQIQNLDFDQSVSGLQAPEFQSTAQLQRDQYAHNAVRQGLGLPDDTTITPELLTQYMQTFSGQSSGDPLGGHQIITNNGLQIIIPNTNPQLENGTFPSGDNSMNVQTTNQQIIFNLLFPKDQ